MKNIIGVKIKELRLSRKMTQNEVVGDFITRNMLSQIETGSAAPSMRTLEYLASVFDVPVSFFLEGNNENAENNNLSDIHLAIKNEDYDQALEHIKNLPNSFSAEADALKWTVFLRLSRKSADEDLILAKHYITLALEALDEDNTYYNPMIKSELLSLLAKTHFDNDLQKAYDFMSKNH